ncbi:MAG: threonine dehydrogenase related Zn-dependent dehydrogenase [Haloquadratum walsbyi J07HQW2]|uniref:Threonine dehydrogenase related Zn-dependent dehydrogenase n=2 Tax=Haloquadratum walsbyi TaxID=293091 RepID=U1NG79_9EURY|nr:MAG: threonine dehydrogenase related Zn-dependent dehydrogenase [Haloquadratum walsbyi J07HQW2]
MSMRAAVYHGPRDIRVEDVSEPTVEKSKDAIVRVTHSAVCGSDLWFYRGKTDRDVPSRVGHEPMGIVEEVGDDVQSVDIGDRVFAPFKISCGFCEFCRRGLHTSCKNSDSWGGDNGGAQGEVIRCRHADGTLVRVPDAYATDDSMLRSILPLTDVMGTGHHAAVSAGVTAGSTCVVVGDGAVGLCGVLAARRLGASRIIAVGHHEDRLSLAREFGATDIVATRGEEAIETVRERTNGGAEHVLECVGATSAMKTAVEVCRPGGTVGYVGVPHGLDDGLDLFSFFRGNITLQGGVAPVRAYADELLADVLQGTLDPSPVFTKTVDLDSIAEGYQAMDERDDIKVLVEL